MEFLQSLVDVFLHLDKHLADICTTYGGWTYGILFLIIFCETGLVVTPFLPGDSLLFAAGAFASRGVLDLLPLTIILVAAAVLGDAANYWLGRSLGPRIFREGRGKLFSKEHLDRTREFFERHGSKAVVLGRFFPVIRTFTPFVAGVGRMEYGRFALFNVSGGILWVCLFVFGGYLFGNLPVVRDNFEVVILAIVAVSIVPALARWLQIKGRRKRGKKGVRE